MAVKSVRKVQPLKQDAATRPPPGQDAAPRAQPEVANDEARQRIAEVAYYRAQQRGFSPGYELEDWLAAEAQIRNGPGPDA
jgi:hypothetical protein